MCRPWHDRSYDSCIHRADAQTCSPIIYNDKLHDPKAKLSNVDLIYSQNTLTVGKNATCVCGRMAYTCIQKKTRNIFK